MRWVTETVSDRIPPGLIRNDTARCITGQGMDLFLLIFGIHVTRHSPSQEGQVDYGPDQNPEQHRKNCDKHHSFKPCLLVKHGDC
jgi:hypothetical protein